MLKSLKIRLDHALEKILYGTMLQWSQRFWNGSFNRSFSSVLPMILWWFVLCLDTNMLTPAFFVFLVSGVCGRKGQFCIPLTDGLLQWLLHSCSIAQVGKQWRDYPKGFTGHLGR